MLSVKELVVRAGDFELGPITLDFASEQKHVILGPSGSGKSLFLKALAGMIAIDSGDIVCQHSNGTFTSIIPFLPERRHIAWLSQESVLFPHLSVQENIRYSLRIHTALPGAESRYAQLIHAFGLTLLLSRSTQSLSGGEIQRVVLARTIVSGRRIMVLDEPFTGLHPGLRRELWELLSRVQAEFGLTVILVTHDIEEACFLGDSLSVLINGQIQQTGTGESVYAQPANRAVCHYFGHRNIWPGTVYSNAKNWYFQTGEFAIQLPEFSIPEIAVLKPIFLGFHAEKIRLTPHLESTEPGLFGRIQSSVCLGGLFQITVITEHWPFPVILVSPQPAVVNQRVFLAIPAEAFFWFQD